MDSPSPIGSVPVGLEQSPLPSTRSLDLLSPSPDMWGCGAFLHAHRLLVASLGTYGEPESSTAHNSFSPTFTKLKPLETAVLQTFTHQGGRRPLFSLSCIPCKRGFRQLNRLNQLSQTGRIPHAYGASQSSWQHSE